MTDKIKRHPASVAFDEWIDSEPGKRCTDTPAHGQYLRNRLWHAFMAAWRASEENRSAKP